MSESTQATWKQVLTSVTAMEDRGGAAPSVLEVKVSNFNNLSFT